MAHRKLSWFPEPSPPERAYGAEHVAARLNSTPASVRRNWRRWGIPFYHCGSKLLIDPADLERFIKERKQEERRVQQ